MPDLGISSLEMVFAASVILLAYFVFGVSGFGSAIVAVPLLTHVLPIQEAVPQIVFLDVITAFLIGRKSFNDIAVNELKWLMPFALIGMVVGVTLLIKAPSHLLLGVLAVFTLFNGVKGLLTSHKVHTVCHRGWGGLTGLVAGGFSALYGTGGPIYAIYLSKRILDAKIMRATMSAIIFLNVWFRVATLSIAGLLLTSENLWRTTFLIPVAVIAIVIGTKFQKRLSPAGFKRFFSVLLIASAITILPKVFTG
jgi:uncharacterized membrane protein YfcA